MTLKQIFTTQSDVVLVKGDVFILESIWLDKNVDTLECIFAQFSQEKKIDILNVYSKSAKN